MKLEIKEKWVKALRSDEYQQGTGGLHCEDKFCCLGVLSDLYAKEHNLEWTEHQSKYKSLFQSSKILPFEVMQWAGLQYQNPAVLHTTHPQSLAELNDNGLSFMGISNLIENQL